jgi:hypothetical protein
MPEQVRVLLDEGVPEKLRAAFSAAFEVETVRYRGWTGLKNGALLRAAEGTFDALVTVDKRLHHQQNVGARDIAVVLDAPGTKFSDLLPLIPSAEAALLRAEPGTVTVVAR